MARNAIWSYVQQVQQGSLNPLAVTSVGSGVTGGNASGLGPQTPSYAVRADLAIPAGSYQPGEQENFTEWADPRKRKFGDDGLLAIGPTYRAHVSEKEIGVHTINQFRSAHFWESFPFGEFREQFKHQQPMKYNISSLTKLARPLSRSDYFLGYVTDPAIAASIGSSGYGQGG